ncbi:DUF3383 family protein [Corallococcus exiguus]|uniref:DUF3383 family protein n=1 Tax=Corallococcus exiguus TaxID=83462 RepID=UPI00147163C4|nr:DUF3383 family protein [Corallococcus exiguus]NNB91480.1 DUF3383 family protein [Corallococcus exiguus]
MGIESVVNVVVTTLTGGVTQQGFGVPLILGSSQRFPERVRYYSTTRAMAQDGFLPEDAEYRMAARVFAQSPRPPRVAVGRRANRPVQSFTFTPTVANATRYAFQVDDAVVEYTSDASATGAEVTAGLVAAWTALTNKPAVTVTDVGPGTAVKAVGAVGAWHDVRVLTPKVLAVTQDGADAGVAADLDACATEQPDWYGVLTPTPSRAETLAIAAWVEANRRLFFVASIDSAHLGAYSAAQPDADTFGALKAGSYMRTLTVQQASTGDFADAGALGYFLATLPGSVTLHLKTLAGVTVLALTETQVANLEQRNASPYVTLAGRNVLLGGKVAGGEFADVVRDTDWFVARLKEALFQALANANKVPFTDSGITVVTSIVGGQAREGVNAGFLAEEPAPVVSAPRASEVPAADKAARRLPGVTLTAYIAGAIHSVDPLSVTLSV